MTGTSFAIPVTSQERNHAVEFKPDRQSNLAEVEIGDGQMDGGCIKTIPDLEFQFQIS